MVLITALCAGLVALACQEKEDFGECILTEQMLSDCAAALGNTEDQCTSDDAFCGPTCVVSDHPECAWGPCLNYKYRTVQDPANWTSDPFCAVGCATDADCPGEVGEATCEAMAGLKIPCTGNGDCTARSPWASCGDDGYCTWHVCIPTKYRKSIDE
jgi:hypothetical protein